MLVMAKKAWAEYIGLLLFVFIGPATAINGGTILQVAFAFGFAIFVLATSIGHHSGGQLNCAVTFALCITGDITPLQGLLNFVAQVLGSISGSFLLWAVFPTAMDRTTNLGSNVIATGYDWHNALIGEILMTFLLLFVVFECAVNPKSDKYSTCLAIGMAVFLAHTVLIAVDGCSINPTRSIGPAIVASLRYEVESGSMMAPADIWRHHWVFWVGPLLGAASAALMSRFWWHPGNTGEQTHQPAEDPAKPSTDTPIELDVELIDTPMELDVGIESSNVYEHNRS